MRLTAIILLSILAIFLAFITHGCTATDMASTPPAPPQVVVKAMLNFKVDGVIYQGIAVVNQKKSVYKIEVGMPDDPVRVLFTTCHREKLITDFKSKTDYTYLYTPALGLEDTGSCIATISIVNDKAVSFLGIIDFKDSESLTAALYCNGEFKASEGVSFCQGREGLTQSITFADDVKIIAGSNCPAMVQDTVKKSTYEFVLQTGLCIYTIQGVNTKKLHRLTTRGYSKLKGE
jgi:hypothetical protein